MRRHDGFRPDHGGLIATRARVDRALLRLKGALRDVRRELADRDLIKLATRHSFKNCTFYFLLYGVVDQFEGGYLFYVYLLWSGPRWSRRILANYHEVPSLFSLHVLFAMFFRPVSNLKDSIKYA
jgi:hypothetical protein